MKLYATISAERGGREASKGDDEQLYVKLYRGNAEIGLLTFSASEIEIEVYNAIGGAQASPVAYDLPFNVARFELSKTLPIVKG